jgi:hypothetical protein
MSASHNGFVSTVWGPPLWFVLHCISMNYPPDPTQEEKLHYQTWFEGLAHVLPCRACRWNFAQALINTDLYNRDQDFVSRTTFTHLMTRLHNHVNYHTGNPRPPMEDEEVCAFYNQFRATDCTGDGCVSTKKSMVCTLHIRDSAASTSSRRFLVEPAVARRVHWI